MPARKPSNLIVRHETADEIAARAAHEAALRPRRALPKNAPAALHGHEVAQETWRQLMRLYNEIEGDIVTRLDMHLLIDYCMLAEQVSEIDAMRRGAQESWKQFEKKRVELLNEQRGDDALRMADKAAGMFENIIKLDGRADRKRDLMFKMRQSLYLTPRARAGVAPTAKPAEEPVDPLEQLLDSVTEYVNGEGSGV